MHTALTVFFPAQGDLKHFSFQPLRNVGWNETAIFYKLMVSRLETGEFKGQNLAHNEVNFVPAFALG
jgi:hypothetical protein